MKPSNQTSKPSSVGSASRKTKVRFHVLGIGASAGGLEALELFIGNIPEDSGLAYVVIQHLDPTQKGMLPELLQRVTKIKVLQVRDKTTIKPNCVYVIPSNKSMTMANGLLLLSEPIENRGMRLPIDLFFNSLATELQELSLGLILSGMGSDGTVGLRSIKEHNGIVMVQDPATAKFDSMPRNALNSLPVDIVAPPDELPVRMMGLLQSITDFKPEVKSNLHNKSALDKITDILFSHTGNDFSLYKKNTLYRRIERRMGIHNIDKISAYTLLLSENPKEVDLLFKELLIGVTNFFRDVAVWQKLKDNVIPSLIKSTPEGTVLRAWIPACSTGEEAYSLAIAFKETLEKINPHGGISLLIYATDLDNESIEIARKGIFPANISENVTSEQLERFFIKTENGYCINSEIRNMLVFAKHNLLLDPPFTKINILSCRNLLIYMDPDSQKKLLGIFYYSLVPEGVMVLGSSESLGVQSHLFTTTDARLKIFKRSTICLAPDLTDLPSSFSHSRPIVAYKQTPKSEQQNIQALADQIILQQFSPAGVLVNEKGDIIYTSKRTGKYLEPAVGKANMNIFAMLREGLRNEFPAAFRKAIINKESVFLHNLKVDSNGLIQSVNVNIHWIDKPEQLNGTLMVIFSDMPENLLVGLARRKGKKSLENVKVLELEMDLQRLREEMQNALEEMQTAQEELKSSNEELQSTNEELQSTNEELTTSKEEMQSLNEELQTVNAELQSKVDDYSRVDNDMKNLLNSIDIATLFLDKELNIRRFTNQANQIFKLIKSDVGRPITDLVSDLIYPELTDDAREVLKSLVFIQKQIPAKDGRSFLIKIMPYRTFDDRIDGLVITFINISEIRQLELALHERTRIQRLLLNASTDIIIQLSDRLSIVEFNPKAETFFGKKQSDVINQDFVKALIPASAQKKTENVLNKILAETLNGTYKIKVLAFDGKMYDIDITINVLLNNSKTPVGLMMITNKI